MAALGNPVATPNGEIDEVAEMVMDEMPCCPHESPVMPDGSKGCPLMALYLAKVATGLAGGLGRPVRDCPVEKGDGGFEPRPVRLGTRGDGYVEIRDGIVAGDRVVNSANFLIDAESDLKATLQGLSDPEPARSDQAAERKAP